jgi:ureidoglycolate hydrolase
VSDVARTVTAGALDAAAWAPFGWLPVPDTDPADGTQRLAFEWADAHANVISHTAEEPARTPSGALVCDRLYRHDTHTQVLLALDGPSVIAVAPAAVGFGDAGDLDAVVAFVLQPLDALVLHRGTWHWGPFPLGAEPVHLFNVQGLGYRDDNACMDLGATGLGGVEVRAPVT